MKKVLIAICIFLSAVDIATASVWEKQRQRLAEAYNRGEVSGEFYTKEMNLLSYVKAIIT